jgi:hypothetical protein
VLRLRPSWLHFRARTAMLDLCNATAADFLDLGHQGVSLVKLLHVVTAANALAHEQNVGYCPPAGALMQEGLQLFAHRVLIELDDVGFRYDAVLFEEDVLRFLRVGAVGLGEDDHFGELACARSKGDGYL